MPSTPEQRKKYAASIKGRATKMWHNASRRSKRNKSCESFEITITPEWIAKKLTIGVCECTGIPFDLSPTDKFSTNPYAPSLDRIDPTIKTYSPENTRVVLSCVNIALNEFGEQTVLPILKAMVAAIENKKC